tara:strand:+ start:162 stop:341 length:180 start_codon:yes stop_codon:yes gene_type:complete
MPQSSTNKKLNMKKKLEKNVAEVIMIALLIVIFSSCGTTQYNVGTGEKMSRHCSGAWVK